MKLVFSKKCNSHHPLLVKIYETNKERKKKKERKKERKKEKEKTMKDRKSIKKL